MTNLKNKTAIITGASGGLGKVIAERYASLGANIVVHYAKNKDKADKIVDTIKGMGVKALAVQADISKVKDIENLFATAKKEFGKIDIVVATAGIELADLPVVEFKEEDYDRLFNTNTKGTYFTIHEAAKTVEDGGRIIYVTSSTTVDPMPGMAIYGGSKMPGNYLIKVLARELGSKGITVNAIAPFAVEGTGMFEVEQPSHDELVKRNPFKRLATPTDVANVAEFFASDLSSFVSGHVLVVTGAAQIA